MATNLSWSEAAAPWAPEPVGLMGASVHPLTMGDLNALIRVAVTRCERWIIAHQNLHGLYLHQADPLLREFFASARFTHIDGMPLVLLGRWLKLPLRREHRVTYVDWTDSLMTEAAAHGWRVFYLGSRPGVAESGAAILRARHPGLRIATSHGWFDATADSLDNADLIARLNAYGPHILMVGMGMPRQEHWIRENFHRLRANVVLPCGACMDYVAGVIPAPPRWMGRLGIEWLYRLASEPRRLWRRYLVEPWALVPLFIRTLRGTRP
jgi:N-acetylglucosaminyldiphosphoundecaprenol N-acetyl-beta-D-mannosaminyltransferase